MAFLCNIYLYRFTIKYHMCYSDMQCYSNLEVLKTDWIGVVTLNCDIQPTRIQPIMTQSSLLLLDIIILPSTYYCFYNLEDNREPPPAHTTGKKANAVGGCWMFGDDGGVSGYDSNWGLVLHKP